MMMEKNKKKYSRKMLTKFFSYSEKILNLKFFYIFIIIFIIISIKTSKNIQYKIYFDAFLKDSSDELKCDIYLNTSTQFSVIIDGIKYPNRLPLYENKTINFKCLNTSKNIKTILMWNKFNGLPHINYKYGIRKPFELINCPVTSCELTNNRNKLDKSDLVLFHLRNNIDYFPNRTSASQKFVHVIYESPINCHLCDKYDDVFNSTASYLTKSDYSSLYWTDSGLSWDINKNFNSTKDYSNKTEFSFALISNCEATNLRNSYIDELKKYIPVKIFGACGEPCPSSTTNCKELLSKKFKFYLAYENSICNDYITEKFFESLKYDIITVVFGGGDYSYYVPKSAYINSLDFKSPKKLADYLIYLSANKTAYNEYFKWKKYVKYLNKNDNLLDYFNKSTTTFSYDQNKITMAGYLCEMCIELHLEDHIKLKAKTIKNLNNLYGLNENCKGAAYDSFNRFKYEYGKNVSYSYFMAPED